MYTHKIPLFLFLSLLLSLYLHQLLVVHILFPCRLRKGGGGGNDLKLLLRVIINIASFYTHFSHEAQSTYSILLLPRSLDTFQCRTYSAQFPLPRSLAHKLATHPRPSTSKMNPEWRIAPCYISTLHGVRPPKLDPKWGILLWC